MSESAMIPAITRTVTVEVPVDRAFHVFTAAFHEWWPTDFHIGAGEPVSTVLEGRVGGRWYERAADGAECDWGRVLAWEPPHRVVATWQINGQWQYDPDPARASEVEVRFVADGPGRTVVTLEHRHIDRLVAAEAAYGAVAGDGGWSGLLERYAKVATAGA